LSGHLAWDNYHNIRTIAYILFGGFTDL